MKNKIKWLFVDFLVPMSLMVLFCYVVYSFATESIQTNLYLIGLLSVFLFISIAQVIGMDRTIRQQKKEMDILRYEVYDDPEIKKIKRLAIDTLQEAKDEELEKEQKIKRVIWIIDLTIFPFFVYAFTPILFDKYFDVFSGRLMYTGQDHYFGFSPTFILDLPYFLPPVVWALALWFCFKIRKQTQNKKSYFNYFIFTLIILNCIFTLYSLWFIGSIFYP